MRKSLSTALLSVEDIPRRASGKAKKESSQQCSASLERREGNEP